MSFNIRNIREISNDPLTKFVNQLAKKFSKSLTDGQIEKLENKEDIYSDGQDIDVVLKFQNLISTKYFDYQTQYKSASEPDGDKLKVWIKGDNIGDVVNDVSGFANHGTLNGDAMILDGTPFDYGIHSGGTKSICTRFNRPTSDNENEEFIEVADSTTTQITSVSTGVSFFIRFRIADISSQGGQDRTLFCKIDDTTPNNAYMAQVSSGGKLQFFVKIGGSGTYKETAINTIAVDTVYEVWFTYANSGNTVHIYVNDVDKSLSNISAPTWPTGTDHDLSIFRKHSTTDGYVYGDFYDFMLFKEKVVSSAEKGFHYTNKLTLADIAFGAVMMSNYWATYILAPQQAYTTTGYTTVGYNT